MSTVTLVTFLQARIDEDERRSQIDGGWGSWFFDPARVLREVEAKRRLVGLEILRYCDNVPPSGFISPEVAARIRGRADTKGLRLLAAVYADHPDYDPSWRP